MRLKVLTLVAGAMAVLTACSSTVNTNEVLDTGPEDTLNRAFQAIDQGQCSAYTEYLVPAAQNFNAPVPCIKMHNLIMQNPQLAIVSVTVIKRTVKPSETDLLVEVKTKSGGVLHMKAIMQKQNGAWLIIEVHAA